MISHLCSQQMLLKCEIRNNLDGLSSASSQSAKFRICFDRQTKSANLPPAQTQHTASCELGPSAMGDQENKFESSQCVFHTHWLGPSRNFRATETGIIDESNEDCRVRLVRSCKILNMWDGRTNKDEMSAASMLLHQLGRQVWGKLTKSCDLPSVSVQKLKLKRLHWTTLYTL